MRHVCFVSFVLVSLLIFWKPLLALITFALTHDYGSHILIVVPISACIVYNKRHDIFSDVQHSYGVSLGLFLFGLSLLWIHQKYSHKFFERDQLSVIVLAIVLLWISGFVLLYGTRACSQARVALLFLLLMVPVPEPLIGRIVFFLQAGSATVAYGLMRLVSVPVFRHGFTLVLPTVDIEVAEECSGIRSSLALMITTLLLGDFVLCSAWRKFLLVIATIPILIFKNGIRITALSLLSIYVSRTFLYGWLHASGGIVFYLLGLAMLLPMITFLRRSEGRTQAAHR